MAETKSHDEAYKLLAASIHDPQMLKEAAKHPLLKPILGKLSPTDKKTLRDIALNQQQTPCPP
jgi:hypothetical protein